MRMGIFILAALGLLVAQAAQGQSVRCFALEFPDSAPRGPEGLAGDTIVLSDVPLGEFEHLLPGD